MNNENLNPLSGLQNLKEHDILNKDFDYLGDHYSKKANVAQQNYNLQVENNFKKSYGFKDAYRDAKRVNHIDEMVSAKNNELSIDKDEDFDLTAEMLVNDNIDKSVWDEFTGVDSMEQYEKVKYNIGEENRVRDNLGNYGPWAGFGTELFASFTDPSQLALGAITGGFSGAAKGISLGRKAATAFKVGAFEGAIYAGVANNTLHTYEARDAVMDVMAGGMLSSVFTTAGHSIGKYRDASEARKLKQTQADNEGFRQASIYADKIEDNYENSHIQNTIEERVDVSESVEFEMTENMNKLDSEILTMHDRKAKLLNNNAEIESSDLPLGTKKSKIAKNERKIKKLEKELNNKNELMLKSRKEFDEYTAMDEIGQYKATSDKMSEMEVDNNISVKEVSEAFEGGKIDPVVRNDSVGAARNFDEYKTTFEEEFNEAQLESKSELEKVDQEIASGTLNNVNRQLSVFDTIQERLNKVGGATARLGDIVFHSVAKTKRSALELQKENTAEHFTNSKIKRPTDAFIRQLGSIDNSINAEDARRISTAVINGESQYVKNGEMIDIAENVKEATDRYNNAVRYFYDSFNNKNRLSAEIDKGQLTRTYMSGFFGAITKSQEGKLSFDSAYTKVSGKKAGRILGSSEAYIEKQEILYKYMESPEQFITLKEYADFINNSEFMESLAATDRAIQNNYHQQLTDMIQVGTIQKDSPMYVAWKNKERYNPHNWSGTDFKRMGDIYGHQHVIDFFAEALMDSADNVEGRETYFQTVASFLVNNTIKRSRESGNDLELRMAFEDALNDFEGYIAREVKENEALKDNPEVQQIRKFLKDTAESKKTKSGAAASNKKRMRINAYYKKQILNGETNVMEDVSVMDFLDTNLERQFQSYANMTSTSVAFGKRGIKSKEELNEAIKEMEQEVNSLKDRFDRGYKVQEQEIERLNEEIKSGKLTEEEIKNAKSDIESYEDFIKEYKNDELNLKASSKVELEEMKKEIMSVWHGTSRIDMNVKSNRFIQKLKSFNFARVMGKMPIAQISEFGEVAHMGGLTNMLSHMPSLKKVLGNVSNLDKTDKEDLIDFLEVIGAMGDNFNSQAYLEVGDSELDIINLSNGKIKNGRERTNLEKLDAATDVGGYKASRLAGFLGNKMDKFIKTSAISANLTQLDKIMKKIVNEDGTIDFDWDTRNVGFDKRALNPDTLNHYGLEVSDLPALKEAFDKYGIFETSFSGNRIFKGFKTDKMVKDNHIATPMIRDFAIITANEAVAPSTVGNSYHILHSNIVASMMVQFRGYMLQSFEHKIRSKFRRENNVAPWFAYMTMFGTASYVLNVLSNAPKYENSEEYLEDKLSLGKLAAGGFSRSAYSYLLPAILGQLESATTGTRYFDDSTRTTGLGQSLSNPTFDLLDNASNSVSNTAKYLTGEDNDGLTKAMKNMVNLLPAAAVPIFGQIAKDSMKSILNEDNTYDKNR